MTNITKDTLVNEIKSNHFTNKQINKIYCLTTGVKYEDKIIDYISSKGKGPSQVAERIFNKMLSTGDIVKYSSYIENPKNYNYLGKEGNLFDKFSYFSNDLINFIIRLEPSVSRISTGKGEILLSSMLGDITDSDNGGDIKTPNKLIEVKNRGAIPMGQKAQFNINTMNNLYEVMEKRLNPKLNKPIYFKNFKGKRPFHRMGLIYEDIYKEDKFLASCYVEFLWETLKQLYKGLNFEGLVIKNYITSSKMEWEKLELDICKEIVNFYINSENFEEILFLDDKKGDYKIIPNKDLTYLLGNEIKITFKDGLPRWSYKF